MTDTELIKSKIDIVDFLSDYITLKKAGRHFKALCPFHGEKTPSFIVSPERQSWHCFGACGMGGDIITFLEKWENIEFVEALQLLAKRAGVTLSKFTPTDTSKIKEKIYEINHLACEFYHFLLTKHKLGQKVKDYLKKRHIKDETINTFLLGYAPASWESLINYLSKKNFTGNDLYEAGLVVKSESGRYYDRFRGRLIFTLKDHRGNIIGFSGRILNGDSDSGAKYINTPETTVYSKGHTLYGLDITSKTIKKKKEAVVVEGEFDFLASWQTGVTNVVAIKGSALTEFQSLMLSRYTENVVLALDSDFAGNEAARRGIEIAEKANLAVRMVKLAYGKDPAECVEKSPHLWKSCVEKAVPVYDFIISQALSKYNKDEAEGKKKIAAEVLPFMAKIQNPIILSHYIRMLSRELNVTEESIEASLQNLSKKQAGRNISPIAMPAKFLRWELLEEHLLSLILQAQDQKLTFSAVLKTLTLDDFHTPPVKTIMELLKVYFSNHDRIDVREFGNIIKPEIAPAFDKAYLTDISNILGKKPIFEKELNNAVAEFKKQSLRRRINLASTKMRQLDKDGKTDELAGLNESVRKLLTELSDIEKSG